MSRLTQHFERIAVISLPEREERRIRLQKNLLETKLAQPGELHWVEAIDGRRENIPAWWKSGAGAWGCRLTHLRVLRQAQEQNLESVLILEDDVVFHPRSHDWLSALMPHLPEDWGQLYLGGEYSESPLETQSPLILQSQGIVRTHAYAVHHTLYDQLIEVIEDDSDYQTNPSWHIDHQLSQQQQNGHWKAYAPSWWLAGQEEGETDIAKGQLPRRWWQRGLHFWKLPFIRVSPTASQNEKLVFASQPNSRDPFELAHWFRRAAFEAWSQGRLPAIPHSLFSESEVLRYWPAGSQECQQANLLALSDYPSNRLFEHPFSQIETTN